jgi:hypothetical protein
MSRLGNSPCIIHFLIHINESSQLSKSPPSETKHVPLVCRPCFLDHQPCTSNACWATVENADKQTTTRKQKKQRKMVKRMVDPDRWTGVCGVRTLILLLMWVSYQCSVSRSCLLSRNCHSVSISSFVNKLL